MIREIVAQARDACEEFPVLVIGSHDLQILRARPHAHDGHAGLSGERPHSEGSESAIGIDDLALERAQKLLFMPQPGTKHHDANQLVQGRLFSALASLPEVRQSDLDALRALHPP